jgi:hypothetical protein
MLSVTVETSLLRTLTRHADRPWFPDRCPAAAIDGCADVRRQQYPDGYAVEQTSESGLHSMKQQLRPSSLHPRFLLICMGAGAQIRVCSIPAK